MSTAKKLALVTGASGGIGETFARYLAAEKYDLLLVARGGDKLSALAQELSSQQGIQAYGVSVDLSRPDAVALVEAKLKELNRPLDLLVNNAGFATFGEYKDLDPVREQQMIQVNVATLAGLTRSVLPAMVKRGQGKILNVASTAAFMPGPHMAVYYATKAFVLSFSEAVNEELKGTGVSVTALCPGPTASGFQSRAGMEKSSLLKGKNLMSSEAVVEAGYKALLSGKAVVVPGLMNKIQAATPRFLPRSWIPGIVKNAQKPVE